MQASANSQGERRRGLAGAFVPYVSQVVDLPGRLETHSNQVDAKYGKYLQDVYVNTALSMIQVTGRVSTNQGNNSTHSLLERKSYKSKFGAGQRWRRQIRVSELAHALGNVGDLVNKVGQVRQALVVHICDLHVFNRQADAR